MPLDEWKIGSLTYRFPSAPSPFFPSLVAKGKQDVFESGNQLLDECVTALTLGMLFCIQAATQLLCVQRVFHLCLPIKAISQCFSWYKLVQGNMKCSLFLFCWIVPAILYWLLGEAELF